jgi:transcription elongation factor Elf1
LLNNFAKKRRRDVAEIERGMPMKKMKCPNCGRRAFDISNLPKEEVEVTLKCPQCGKFVSVPCNEEMEIKAS